MPAQPVDATLACSFLAGLRWEHRHPSRHQPDQRDSKLFGTAKRQPSAPEAGAPFVTGSSLQYFDSPQTDSNFPLTPSGPVYNTINGVRTQIVATGFGNVPRNSNRAPGEVDFDASVSRDFRLYERLNFQLRVDAFNVINHTNFGLPSTSLTVSETGTIASFGASPAKTTAKGHWRYWDLRPSVRSPSAV